MPFKIKLGFIVIMLLAGCKSSPQQSTVVNHGDYQLEILHQARGFDQRIRFLVIHYTAEDFHTSLKILTDENVSAHYLLPAHPSLQTGKLQAFQLLPEDKRAWHAGVSFWRGRTHLNDTSIGIEVVNDGVSRKMLSTDWPPYPPEQIDLLIRLSRDIVQRYAIQPNNVVGHSDIAPQRKQDPGPHFPWQKLAKAGIGAWPDEGRIESYLSGRDRRAPVPIARMVAKLACYGYGVDPTWDVKQQKNVVAAFQMHFRPDDYRGEPDAESEAIIDALLSQYGTACR